MTVPGPRAARRPGCGLCGHPKALHSNCQTPCRAFSCTAALDGTACPGFMTGEQAGIYLQTGVTPPHLPRPEAVAS